MSSYRVFNIVDKLPFTMFPKKAKKPSIVWKYFFKVKTDSCNSNEVQCRLCSIRVKSSGNTTNLSNHLNRKHKQVVSIDPNVSVKVIECWNVACIKMCNFNI